MIKKIIPYLQSGGLKEVLGYGLTYFRKLFYYRSETIYLYLYRSNCKKYRSEGNDKIKFEILFDIKEIQQLRFPRIKTVPYKKWIEKGSAVIVGFYKNEPISFAWLHYLAPDNNIRLKQNQCWTGPTFVDRRMRKKGVNTAQKFFQLNNADECVEIFLTSVNINNVASFQTNINAGFRKGLTVVKYYGVFTKKRMQVRYQNQGEQIFKWNGQ